MMHPIARTLLFFLVSCPAAYGSTYYVDSAKGSDDNGGTTPSAAWKSLAKISSFKFSPGDTIFLRRGSLWHEELDFPSSGSAAAPITIDAYGEGALPVIDGADLVPSSSWKPASNAAANVWQASVPTKP